MSDIKQIKTIAKKLNKEKEKYLSELMRLNLSITNKKNMVIKIQSYQHEYVNSNNLTLSKSIPALNKNIGLFVRKMEIIRSQAQLEIDSLVKIRDKMLETIGNIDRKIDLMNKFESKYLVELNKNLEKQEQTMIDDIATTLEGRMDDD